MRHRRREPSSQAQRGFSMVEMLMTAFILAVGIMGLTLLQMMSLKGARGGKSLSTAVQVGETVMDQIEMEGRLSWLNLTASQYKPPAALTTLNYVDKATLATPLTFTVKGQVPLGTAPDLVDRTPFYTVNFRRTNDVLAGTGTMSDFNVTVTFTDQVDATTNVAIPRTVQITRRVLHG